MEDWGSLSQGKDLSLAAFLRLQEIEESRSAASSALCIRKDLLRSLPSQPASFVPFLQERDPMGHLYHLSSARPLPALQTTRSLKSLSPTIHSVHTLEKVGKTLGSKGKLQVPSVGTYSPTAYIWMRKDFAKQRKGKAAHGLDSKQQVQGVRLSDRRSKEEMTPSFQYAVKRHTPAPKPKGPFDILRPEVLCETIKRTNFQSVHLEDSPDSLRANIQWPERKRMKDEKLSTLMRAMNQFRKGKLFG